MFACVYVYVCVCVRVCVCVCDLLAWQREHWRAGHSHACASLQGSAGDAAHASESSTRRKHHWKEWEICVEEEPEEGDASQHMDIQQRLADYNKRIGLEGAYSLKEVEGIAQVWR